MADGRNIVLRRDFPSTDGINFVLFSFLAVGDNTRTHVCIYIS